MKKLKDSVPSPSRVWYNNWISKNAKKGEILDIGKSQFWDYSDLSYCYKTMDINPKIKPDFVGDICNNTLCNEAFDVILCNRMYEFVSDPQKMADEVYRLLKKGGTAIFGFVGRDYKPYKKNWKFYEYTIDFKKFEILKQKDFDKNYHFIVCKK